MSSQDLSDLRREYIKHTLDEKSVPQDPLKFFDTWFKEYSSLETTDPNAVVLATTDGRGNPTARIVLMKGYGKEGFSFFTNYLSRKGKELEQNPRAAFLFYWPELERQIRIEGNVKKLDTASSDEYFNSRPERSRISAIVSEQSEEIESRELLEKQVENFSGQIDRPIHWGGYLLNPDYYEFWQGRANRLHDRVKYKNVDGEWTRSRLAP